MMVAGLLFVGCERKDTSSSATNASSGNPLTAPVDYLGAAAKAKRTAESTVGNVSLSKAIEMFHAHEGRYPKTLNELARPDYLPSIPPPPAGMKYDYNPTTGQVRIVPQ